MLRRMSLRTQLLWLQVGIVMLTVAGVGFAAMQAQAGQIRESSKRQMIGVAQSVALLPSVREAFDDRHPSLAIQPIAELIRKSSGVTYVVVTDDHGIRYSHPNENLIGKHVSTDASAPLAGKTYIGTQTGTLGESWRVKVPIRDRDGHIIGTVSVGTLESDLRDQLYDRLPGLVIWLIVAALIGTLAAAWVSRLIWLRIYRLEPEEIATLLETRDAMLHSIGEGMVAVDEHGRVELINDEAKRLLGLGEEILGRPAGEVLDEDVVALLESGTESRLVLAGERILVGQRSDAVVAGQVVGSVLVLRDRTELHRVLRDLDGARDLTEALRAQAHEFANVMHVVSGLIEIGRTSEAVEFIGRSGYGGALSHGGLAPGVSDPGVTALLLAKVATSREHGTELRIDPDSAIADGEDTRDVVTVLGNLVDNAVDAAGPGGVVRVSLGEQDGQNDGGGTTIVVEDDGPGVPESDRATIFASGWSTKADGQARGIGLALVGRLAARRGGTVEVTDSELGGARFEVRLPRVGASVGGDR